MKKIDFQKVQKRVAVFSLLLLAHYYSFAQSLNCIDLTNLNVPYIHCTYGVFANPYLHEGIASGRHTVITNQGTDPHTNGGLALIPPGENYSVRLGDLRNGGNAESISVDIVVDTTAFNLLILKYAAVIEDPQHDPADQPRFTFDILDVQNHPIDPDCLSANFVADASLGWHSLNGGALLWKDWTNVGVDISEYHGQTIRVRLTTYDCAFTAHFGYAYFLLSCGNKLIEIEDCGDEGYYSFSAPDGFNYNWYWIDTPSQTISTNRTVSVPAGSNRTLQCHVSFIGNPDCGFDLYTTPEYRFPISGFAVQETNCPQTFNFINQSAVSNDGITPNGSGSLCEDVYWDFGDGHVSYLISPCHTYDLPGDYSVMQVAGLNGFSCVDTSFHSINVPPDTVFDTISCEAFLWNNTSYTTSGTYSQNYTSIHGCDSLVTVNLTIKNSVTNSYEDMGCDKYVWNSIEYETSGSYQQVLPNQFGCDSVVTLYLDMEYTPEFRIIGNHYPIAGTEEAYTIYKYEIEFVNPFSKVDSVSWLLGDHNGFDLQPIGNGLNANLYLFAHSLDSIEIKANVFNRCGVEEYSFWFHTSYYDVEEHEGQSLFDIFPNPSSGEFKLCFSNVDELVNIKVFAMGAEILEKVIKPGASTQYVDIDMKGYPNGVYCFVINYKGKTYVKKCIIKK